MGTYEKNAKGFSAIELLLGIVLLTVVGGAAYFVGVRGSEETTTKTETSVQEPAKSTETAKKYLEIKEYGIKFELSKDIEDAYYAVSKEGYVYLSSKYFDNVKGFEGCRAEGESGKGLLGIERVKLGDVSDPFGGVYTEESLKQFTKVGDYYYLFMKGNAGPCFDETVITQQSSEFARYTAIITAFSAQQKTITTL